MSDPGLNNLLKWSIKHSSSSGVEQNEAIGPASTSIPNQGLNPEALAQLFGGPSDADRMRDAMAAVQSTEVDLDNKNIAFDNLEQLIENIDNANNMESLGLWMPLVEQLDSPEPSLRVMAAWCIGTAVQNNPRAQDRCLVVGAIPKLVNVALNDNNQSARKKAILALSSEVRNYQPALDELLTLLPQGYQIDAGCEASDMGAVDSIVNKMRDDAKSMMA